MAAMKETALERIIIKTSNEVNSYANKRLHLFITR